MPAEADPSVPPPGSEHRDDLTITAETRILRRIPPGRSWVQLDPESGDFQPTSGNFDNHDSGTGTSVDIWEGDRTPENMLTDEHRGFGVVSLTVEEIRCQGLGVIRWPEPDNPFHALLQGPKPGKVKKSLKRSARWEIQPQ